MRTSGKVLKDFENLRKALFDEEISHIAFMRDGKPKILYTQKYVDKLEQEIERLNNIINEIEKDIKNLYTYGIKNNAEQRDYLLNRLEGLKEYKGSDKE